MHDAVFILCLLAAVAWVTHLFRAHRQYAELRARHDRDFVLSAIDVSHKLFAKELARIPVAELRSFMGEARHELRTIPDIRAALYDTRSYTAKILALLTSSRSDLGKVFEALALTRSGLVSMSESLDYTGGELDTLHGVVYDMAAFQLIFKDEIKHLAEIIRRATATPVPSRSPSPTPESSAGPSPVASRSSSPVPMRATSPVPVPSSDHLPPRPASAAAQDRPRQICRAYQRGTCRRPDDQCRHLHICAEPGCGGRHPASACPGLS
ncbi:uncharacterized protein PFL1_03281 [Pseudozyma flocculosa PF-1]|uniref:C3H1-type domain-containing protein n=2 Tax=Pseudozyma flocculosa TaxID=84751 RepID=A0A5C3F639_9BASI|nr:uncharacterized protein PFL1_03281 [Pseudozyma flocculosa PF-1]EPQ28991.1 hypothetical protein PFL1_03281 [Pseudozyma flocculosa PF-1]SPO39984.1 uncharacterized protein PSFLO_05466 [Pseudozyma flocculosa]